MYGKKRLRSAALLLALLMMVLGLFSCKNQKKQPSGTGEKNTGGIPENRLPVPVEAEDNGMRDFKILMPETNTIDMPTEEGGNFVSQTLFRADSKIEEHLRVLISYTAIPGNWKNKNTFNNRLMGMSLSDYSEFDLIMAETSASYSYALQNCLVMDLTQIKELTLANPWYLDNMVETYGINGKLFGARSDASLTTYESLNVIYFNTAMIARLNLNDPYELVRENKWTAEEMFNMALEVTGNSSDQVDLAAGTFGYLGQHVASRGYMVAFDVNLVEKSGEDGNYYLKKSADEILINKWTYLYNLFDQHPTQIYSPVAADAELGEKAFSEGRSLFYNGFFSHAPKFVKSEGVQWGVVPMPMYNIEQGRYYTPAGTQAMMLMIMTNAYKTGLSAKVMELKSYYNYYEAVPKYYEETLGYQYGTSPVHIEMMNLIRQTATLTFIGAMCDDLTPSPYNMFSMDDYIRKTGETAACLKGSLSNWYSTNVDSWNAHLKDLYDHLK